MYYPQITAVLFLAGTVQAHWFLHCISQNGVDCGNGGNHMGTYDQTTRVLPGYDHPVWPLSDPISADQPDLLECGHIVPGQYISASTPPLLVPSGQIVNLKAYFRHTLDAAPYDIAYNANHHGFTQVYIAPFYDANTAKGSWTKLYTKGLTDDPLGPQKWNDPANTDACKGRADKPPYCQPANIDPFIGWWATDQLRLDGGSFAFSLPSSLPPGKYILRAELLTTPLPDTVLNDRAQFYTGCVALQVGSSTAPGVLPVAGRPLTEIYAAGPQNEFLKLGTTPGTFNVFGTPFKAPATPGGDVQL